MEAAIAAIAAEPLRESAQRALIEAHLGEGNWVEAHRGFVTYRDLLRRELGVSPSHELASFVYQSASTWQPETAGRPAAADGRWPPTERRLARRGNPRSSAP